MKFNELYEGWWEDAQERERRITALEKEKEEREKNVPKYTKFKTKEPVFNSTVMTPAEKELNALISKQKNHPEEFTREDKERKGDLLTQINSEKRPMSYKIGPAWDAPGNNNSAPQRSNIEVKYLYIKQHQKDPEKTDMYQRYLNDIMKNPHYAYEYTIDIRRGNRWYPAERYIADDPHYAYLYAKNIIKGRFPEAEPFIAIDEKISLKYAKEILKGAFPKAEMWHMNKPRWMAQYRTEVIDNPQMGKDDADETG